MKAAQLKLHETYSVRTTLNPFFLTGDFNGDGTQDLAVWVARVNGQQVGLIILHGGRVGPVTIGAGMDWDKRGTDYSWTDMWTIQPRGTVLKSGHELAPQRLTKADALVLTKSESAAFAIFWNGRRYRSYQLSD